MNDSYGYGRDRGDRATGGRGYSGRQDNPSRYSERPGGRSQGDYDDALESVQRHSVVNGTVLHEDDDGGIIVQINGARFEGKVSETELRLLPPEMQTDLREEGHTCEFFVRRTPARNSHPDEPMYYDLTITGLWREEDWRLAEDALRSGDVFPAVPTKYNKGGLLVRFGRMLEGFVPISHIWNFPSFREPEQREEALNRWVNEGEEMMVKVIEVTRDKRKLVLSNKEAILDRNREDKAALFETLQVGDVVE
ncbi:MAG: S1 RNA-binding domain-containing protein, partial [Caldilineaceae bacterium]|nr:S1 RNA-binding domain-containing protein [Caldilineaceae bacterium]